MERKFYLKSSTDLQRIGLRAQIVSFLMGLGFERGNAVNNPDDKREVIVALAAKDISEIKEARDSLVKYLNELHEQDPICYPQIPSDITASDLFLLDNPHGGLTAMEFNKLADCLMLEQTSKGTGALLSLSKVIEGLSNKIDSSNASLTHAIETSNASLTSAIRDLRDSIISNKK